MSRGRYVPRDPFAPTNEPRFLVMRDLSRQVLECEPLPLGSDQRAAFKAAQARMTADGWVVEEPWKYSFEFYCTKDGRRVTVGITGDPNAKSDYGPGPSAGIRKSW